MRRLAAMPRPIKVTERTFYDALLNVIRDEGGTGVQEVSLEDGMPDIVFELLDRRWLLSVRIGDSPATIKDVVIQYLRHKERGELEFGLILLLPHAARKVPANEAAVAAALDRMHITVLVDAGAIKSEYRDRTFRGVMRALKTEVSALIRAGATRPYPLGLVVRLLREQVEQTMGALSLKPKQILAIVTNQELLAELGHLDPARAEQVARFLASYIVLSQILFLRLFVAVRPAVAPERPVTKGALREAFNKILAINYRPIYATDVLDSVPAEYLRDTFDLIWALEVERVQHELPGRIFHELMPKHIRKLLAAFYTRPQAAQLLARLVVDRWDASVFDPACGSGTLLVAAYRAKEELYRGAGLTGSPHERFCEEDIFGADIMPFAAHLTTANLAAIDVATTIDRTQVLAADSIELAPGKAYKGAIALSLFPSARVGRTLSGEAYEVPLREVDVVVMNPPFTKVERRIADYIDMDKFKARAGGEVGLWGHFVFLADQFLLAKAKYGAVLPVNVLRGRESAPVREFLFFEWTPLYVLKATVNYGFSEWAEYRDVLLVAQKKPPADDAKVKFALIKRDVRQLSPDDIAGIVERVGAHEHLRSADLDIDAHPLSDLRPRFNNLMWFCGVSDLRHRDLLVPFVESTRDLLDAFPAGYFHEGYRPVPKGVSQFLFLTRATHPARIEEAFLSFARDGKREITARSPLGAEYVIERTALRPTLRTPVALPAMDVTADLDYIAHEPYAALPRVRRAAGQAGKLPADFWPALYRELDTVKTHLVTVNRINPFSPHHHLVAFASTTAFSPSNQLNVLVEQDETAAKAVAVLLNSALFLAQFFILKEESTGRYVHIRFYDLREMRLYPRPAQVPALAAVYDRFRARPFPSLQQQFDADFETRYEEFWERQRKPQLTRLTSVLAEPVRPADVRLEFDLVVGEALGLNWTEERLRALYDVFVREMIVTRGLTRD